MKNWVLGFVVFVVLVMGVRLWLVGNKAAAAEIERDKAATSLLISLAEQDGLEVTLGEVVSSLSELQSSSADSLSALQQTIARLEASGVREASVATLEITASRDTVTIAIVDTIVDGGTLHAEMDDGVADIKVDCKIRDAECRWRYELTLTGRLFQAIGADGRPIAIAESDQPNVTFRIPSLVWKLPNESKPGFFGRILTTGCVGVAGLASGFTLADDRGLTNTAIAASLGCVLGHIAF